VATIGAQVPLVLNREALDRLSVCLNMYLVYDKITSNGHTWNDWRMAFRTVRQIWWNDQLPLLSKNTTKSNILYISLKYMWGLSVY